ncbi:hypothetical protein HPB48_004939 [Haemaphysalis longicornis]|uniref:Uncharacterized protein n=1 Tax=Haemaphysalis longicornis TaxID=44386 RepID=A0A9J6GCU5_HAELO|nr:hypothetical protein HPB48_004939 [Haemaphysalis longicornis]
MNEKDMDKADISNPADPNRPGGEMLSPTARRPPYEDDSYLALHYARAQSQPAAFGSPTSGDAETTAAINASVLSGHGYPPRRKKRRRKRKRRKKRRRSSSSGSSTGKELSSSAGSPSEPLRNAAYSGAELQRLHHYIQEVHQRDPEQAKVLYQMLATKPGLAEAEQHSQQRYAEGTQPQYNENETKRRIKREQRHRVREMQKLYETEQAAQLMKLRERKSSADVLEAQRRKDQRKKAEARKRVREMQKAYEKEQGEQRRVRREQKDILEQQRERMQELPRILSPQEPSSDELQKKRRKKKRRKKAEARRRVREMQKAYETMQAEHLRQQYDEQYGSQLSLHQLAPSNNELEAECQRYQAAQKLDRRREKKQQRTLMDMFKGSLRRLCRGIEEVKKLPLQQSLRELVAKSGSYEIGVKLETPFGSEGRENLTKMREAKAQSGEPEQKQYLLQQDVNLGRFQMTKKAKDPYRTAQKEHLRRITTGETGSTRPPSGRTHTGTEIGKTRVPKSTTIGERARNGANNRVYRNATGARRHASEAKRTD